MNIQNIDKAIAIMQRAEAAQSFNLTHWQSNHVGHVTPVRETSAVTSEEELHRCGNKACFAGHIAISKEFQEDLGCVSELGYPIILGRSASDAIAYWLGIDPLIASHMVYYGQNENKNHFLYGRKWYDVEPKDVIRVLNELKEIGEKALIEKYNLR